MRLLTAKMSQLTVILVLSIVMSPVVPNTCPVNNIGVMANFDLDKVTKDV